MAVRRAKRGRGKTGARKKKTTRRKAAGRKRAAGKKARAKATRKKGAARKKSGAARKKVARKKAPRRAATRKKATRGKASGRAATRKRSAVTAKRKTVAAAPRKPPVAVAPAQPSVGGFQPQTVKAADASASGEANPEDVGTVTHYYPHANAAIVRVERGGFRVGDTLEFQGFTTNFRQRVGHIELEHESVGTAAPGQVVGIQVTERVREHDRVRKVP